MPTVYLGPPSTCDEGHQAGQDVTVFGNVMDQIPDQHRHPGQRRQGEGHHQGLADGDRIKALKGLTIGVNAAGSAPEQVLQYHVALPAGLDPEKDVKIAPGRIDSGAHRQLRAEAHRRVCLLLSCQRHGGREVRRPDGRQLREGRILSRCAASSISA
jgi:hypothetical protein